MYKDITECCCASQKPTLQDPVLPYGISVKAYLSPTPADGQAAVEEHEAREAMTETAKVLAREPAYGCARGQLGAKRAQRHGWQGMAGARSFAAPEYGNRVHARDGQTVSIAGTPRLGAAHKATGQVSSRCKIGHRHHSWERREPSSGDEVAAWPKASNGSPKRADDRRPRCLFGRW